MASSNSSDSKSLFDESGQLRSSRSTEEVRSKLSTDVEAFLASGGQIEVIDRNVRGDPVKKPKSNYGSRPI